MTSWLGKVVILGLLSFQLGTHNAFATECPVYKQLGSGEGERVLLTYGPEIRYGWALKFEGFKDGVGRIWSVEGEYICRRGDQPCSINLPATGEDDFSTSGEQFDDGNKSYLVFPGLTEEIQRVFDLEKQIKLKLDFAIREHLLEGGAFPGNVYRCDMKSNG